MRDCGSLRLRIRTHSGTLRLLSHAALADLTPQLAVGTYTQAEALVETIQRAWLFAGGVEPFTELPQFRAVWQRCGLSEALIAALDRWLLDQRTERTYDEPVGWASLAPAGLQRILRELLHAWSVADGAIVFVRDIDDPDILPATLLPFLLHLRTTADQPLATTKNGEPGGIELNDSIKLANDHARRKGWIGKTEQPCLELHTLPDPTDVKIGGGSGGLPVLIAHRFRHAGLRVPALRLGASGVLNSAGALSSVTEVEQYTAKHALFCALGIASVILPEPMPGGWPSGVDITRQLDALVRELRQQYGEAVPPQLKGRLIDFRSHLDSKRSLFTGREWLFEKIELWQHDGEEHVMLLVGDPGLGKSSIIAEFLNRNLEEVVAHHCCVFDEIETLRSGRFVQSIAAMLADRIPEYAMQLTIPAVADALSDKRCEDDPAGAFSEGILNPLHKVRPPEDGIRYILVDALDEAICYEGRVNIVELLAGRIERMPTWIRVVATTRNDPYVLKRLSGFRTEDLNSAEALNTSDIVLFITRRLKTPELVGKLTESGVSAEAVISLLTKRSAGNFLYAVHALDDVQFDRDRFDGFVNLPSGLEGLYLRFFERVFGRARSHAFDSHYSHARTLLEVILAAHEPLTAAELSVATGLDAEMELPRLLRQLAQYLPQRLRNDGQKTFAFYHKSFSDWLSSDHVFHINKKTGNRRLADFCIGEESNRTSLSYYVRRHAIAHFSEVEEWDRVTEWLSNLQFIEARACKGEILALQFDYAFVLQKLPDAQEDNRREKSLHESVDRWTYEIVKYAGKWSSRREQLAEGKSVLRDEPICPKAPEVVPRWSHERIATELKLACENPTRLQRIRAFSQFVATSAYALSKFADRQGFVVQQALNSFSEGPVHKAASILLPHVKSPLLLRIWGSKDRYTRMPECVRVLTAHRTHESIIVRRRPRSLSVTPNGRLALSCGEGETLIVWDLETGARMKEFDAQSMTVCALSMTPDGRVAVSGDKDGEVRVWDLENCKCLHVLKGHSGEIASLCVTPDGRRAVSDGKFDDTLRVWDLKKGECCSEVQGRGRAAGCMGHPRVSVAADGCRAIICDGTSTLALCDLNSGQVLKPLDGQIDGVESVAITPDGRLAVSGDIRGIIRVWDLESGICLHVLNTHTEGIKFVAVTPDGKRALSAGWDALRVWDLENGRCLHVIKGHMGSLSEVSIIANGSRAVSVDKQDTLRVWDLEKGMDVQTNEATPNTASWMPGGRFILSGDEDGALRKWEIETGECLDELKGHSIPVTAVSMTPDGRVAVSGDSEGVLRIWDLEEGKCLQVLKGHTCSINDVCVTPDGRRAVSVQEVDYKVEKSAQQGPGILLWDLENGKCLGQQGARRYGENGICMMPDGCRMISCGEHSSTAAQLWSLKNGEYLSGLNGDDPSSVAVAPDGRRVILGYISWGLAWVWDVESNCLHELSGLSSDPCLTPDGRRVVSGSRDGTLCQWNLENGSVLQGTQRNPEDFGLRGAKPTVTSDGRHALSHDTEGVIRIWDLKSGECLVTLATDENGGSVIITKLSTPGFIVMNDVHVFFKPHNFPPSGPLITTASRRICSEDSAPSHGISRPPCCGTEFALPDYVERRIDTYDFPPAGSDFDDPTLLIPCPNCKTLLKFNPFFVEIREAAQVN